MANNEQIDAIFRDVFQLDDNFDLAQCVYQETEGWDSVAHMVLIAEIEDQLGLILDTEDIIEMSSHTETLRILRKYGIE